MKKHIFCFLEIKYYTKIFEKNTKKYGQNERKTVLCSKAGNISP